MASRFYTRPAQANDSDELIALIAATPQAGAITINFERSPDFFMATKVICLGLELLIVFCFDCLLDFENRSGFFAC